MKNIVIPVRLKGIDKDTGVEVPIISVSVLNPQENELNVLFMTGSDTLNILPASEFTSQYSVTDIEGD